MNASVDKSEHRAETTVDVILSSGFLAFASHLGFLSALGELEIAPRCLVGTSSGALVGALAAAGVSVSRIASILTRLRPLGFLRPHWAPWEGAFTAGPLLTLLSRELPRTFEDLGVPFAVGVARADTSAHQLITTGLLPEAVLASCAVPRLLRPVALNRVRYIDGGAVDRTGVKAWCAWRPERTAILHRVERSMGTEVPYLTPSVLEVVSPRSNNSLWRLRDFEREIESARERTLRAVRVIDVSGEGR